MGVDYGNNLQWINAVKREVNELLHHEEIVRTKFGLDLV